MNVDGSKIYPTRAKQVTTLIGCPHLELVQGEGYWYFVYDDQRGKYETQSVQVLRLNHLTMVEWISEGKDFVATMESGKVETVNTHIWHDSQFGDIPVNKGECSKRDATMFEWFNENGDLLGMAREDGTKTFSGAYISRIHRNVAETVSTANHFDFMELPITIGDDGQIISMNAAALQAQVQSILNYHLKYKDATWQGRDHRHTVKTCMTDDGMQIAVVTDIYEG